MPTTRAARRLGAFFAVAALVLAAPLSAGSVDAASSPSVDRQAWSASGPAAPPNASADAIYASVVAGQEQARAYLHIDTAGADESQLAAGSIMFTEASDTVMGDQAALAACALAAPFTGSGQLSGTPPAADCSTRAPLSRNADGTWTLPLGVFASALASGSSPGLTVFPDIGSPTATFTVSFTTAKTAVAVPVGSGAGSTSPASTPPATTTATNPSVTTTPTTTSAAASSATIPASASPEGLVPPPAPTTTVAPAGAGGAGAAGRPTARPRHRGGAASPPAAVILIPVAIAAAVLLARWRWGSPEPVAPAMVPTRTVASTAVWLAVILFALLSSEATAYKLGFIGIVFVGAIGLHILVNWSGELSLAHAGFIGLPAFAVAQASSHSGWSPILFVPVGVAVGALLGLIVAIAALRARGLQVALVTLAVGIGISQFFFVRTWVIGPNTGLHIPVPSLFGVHFDTAHSLLPVLAVIVALAVFASRAILGSKVGRAFSMLRANPDAAAAAGIPVAFYRGIAYSLAGAFAGLAGASYVLWVQRVSPNAFPLDLGFTYLVIAVLAGRGGLTALAISAIFLEGGRLFSIIPQSLALYLGPIGLIYNVTRYQEGFNGVLRETRQRLVLRHRKGVPDMATEETSATAATGPDRSGTRRGAAVRLPVALAVLLLVAGFSALALAWYHAGNTDQVWIQNQELVSGGAGGLGLIIVGSALLIRDALLHGRVVHAPGGMAPNASTNGTDGSHDRTMVMEGQAG